MLCAYLAAVGYGALYTFSMVSGVWTSFDLLLDVTAATIRVIAVVGNTAPRAPV